MGGKFSLEKSKSSTVIETSRTLNSTFGPPNVYPPDVDNNHESSILRIDNPLASNKQMANGENGNGVLCTNGDADEINSDVIGEFYDFNNNYMHTDTINIFETILSSWDYERSDVNYDASYESEYFQELYNKFRKMEIKKKRKIGKMWQFNYLKLERSGINNISRIKVAKQRKPL